MVRHSGAAEVLAVLELPIRSASNSSASPAQRASMLLDDSSLLGLADELIRVASAERIRMKSGDHVQWAIGF